MRLQVLDSTYIPPGLYCYRSSPRNKKDILCPYWERRNDKPERESGYCYYLKRGDWESPEDAIPLLWDQVKECNVSTQIFPSKADILKWAKNLLSVCTDQSESAEIQILIDTFQADLNPDETETGIPCFVCGIRSGVECPGRYPNEPTRCKICLEKFLCDETIDDVDLGGED